MGKLFVYGTLQEPAVQQRVVGRQLTMQADALEGFTKGTITINGNSYFIAIAEHDAQINCQTLEVTADEIVRLDEYETAAYARVRVTLKSEQNAWVYCKP